MTRIKLVGRNNTAPSYRSPFADRFEPTSASRFRELYHAQREPLWKTLAGWAVVIGGVVSLVLLLKGIA